MKPNRLLPQVGAAVAGGVIGLICGFLYSLAIFTLALDHSYSPPPSPSPDPGIVALFTIGAIVPVASCLFFGIGLARSGRRIEAAFVIAFGIGASSPQAACDVGSLVSLHHGDDRAVSDGPPMRRCPKCDAAFVEGARACPNCGWLAVRGPLELQAGDGVGTLLGSLFCAGVGCVAGLVCGVIAWSWLSAALATVSPSSHDFGYAPRLAWNWWVGLVMVGCQAAVTVPCLLGGLLLLRRGDRAFAFLVLTFGTFVALPAAACDFGYAFPNTP